MLGTKAKLEASDTATAADSTNSSAVAISADGRYLALATTAALVPSDTNRLIDVYRLDLQTGTWQLVSVPASGAVSATVAGTVLQTGSSVYATSPSVAIPANGDRVLFYSARADLVSNEKDGAVDLFAKDMGSGAVTRVSSTATGGDLASGATGPAVALTPDGRYALFPANSSSGPLVLYRKDLSTGALLVASSVTTGSTTTAAAVFRDAGDVAVSDDGSVVAFSTAAKLLTSSPGASYGTGLAYRKDLTTGAVTALGSGQTSTWEHQVALDATGRYGFFETAAGEVTADGNSHTDVYRRDTTTGALVLVTATSSGAAAPGQSSTVSPTEYGPLVVLSGDSAVVTTAQPLVPGDTNGVRDVYRAVVSTGAVASVV